MLIAKLFIVAKTQKQPKSLSIEECIKKMWHSPIEMNDIMSYVITSLDIEIVVLSEVSQTEKDKYCMASLTCGT